MVSAPAAEPRSLAAAPPSTSPAPEVPRPAVDAPVPPVAGAAAAPAPSPTEDSSGPLALSPQIMATLASLPEEVRLRSLAALTGCAPQPAERISSPSWECLCGYSVAPPPGGRCEGCGRRRGKR